MKGKFLFIVLILIFTLTMAAGPVFGTDLKKFKGQKIIVTCWSGPYVENFKNAVVNPFMKESGAIVVVSPGFDPKGILNAFKLRLRRSDPASPAKKAQIDGYPVLSAPGSVTGSDICAKGSKFI